RGDGPYELEMTSSTTYVIRNGSGADVTADSVQGGVYSIDMENPKINFRGVEFILDATLASGTVDADAALAGHTFSFDMAPDRFVTTSSSAAQITDVSIDTANPDDYVQAFPIGGMKLTFTATGFSAFTMDGVLIDDTGVLAGTPPSATVAGVTLTFGAIPADGDEFKIHADSQ